MSIRLRRRCWFALAIALVASDALRSRAVAQTVVRFRISDTAIANGSPGGCRTAVFTAPASATHDTIRIDVYSAADTTKHAKAGTRLLVLLGVTEIAAVAAGDTGIALARPVGDVSGANVFLIRADSRGPLCASGINPPLTRIIRDSVLRRLVEVDSATLDSARERQRLRGSSFVALSLIKSIAGHIPRDEFFDLRMKFGGEPANSSCTGLDDQLATVRSATALPASLTTHRDSARADSVLRALGGVIGCRKWTTYFSSRKFFTMASIDISLSTRSDTTAADSAARQLTDAGFALNYIAAVHVAPIPDRMSFVSGLFKIFNTRGYIGGGVGGMELRGSRLEGTYVQVSYLHRVYADSIKLSKADSARQAALIPDAAARANFNGYEPLKGRDNIYIEFFVRVPKAQFLDRLRIRGGVLLPIRTLRAPETRIVLSVPIVDLDRF